MKIGRFKLLLLVTLCINSSAYAFFGSNQEMNKCEKEEWTKSDSRTQGGGWIWFPGKGTADTLELANLKAEGMAIGRLNQECRFPHREVKVHERCNEKIGNFHRAFVRISLRGKECQETRYASSELKRKIFNTQMMKTYRQYQKLTQKNSGLPATECTSDLKDKCHALGKYDFQMGDFHSALKNFDVACRAQKGDSCFNAGLTAQMLKKFKKALGYFKLACIGSNGKIDAQSCLFTAKLFMQSSRSKQAIVYLNKACDKEQSEACFQLGKIYHAKNNILKSQQYFEKSCGRDFKEGCFEISKIYYDNKKFAKAKKFATKGCQLEHKKSCYNLGFLENNDKSIKLMAFQAACNLGLSLGCMKAAKLKRNNISPLTRACDLGNSIGCKKLSTYYFDHGKKDQSLKFSRLACKLGEMKSCHNVGFLEYRKGQNSEAKLYLGQSCNSGINASCKLLKKIN